MVTSLYSSSLSGINAYLTEIEVDIKNGLPTTIIVGLPDKAVEESKDRVKSALVNSGFKFPSKRIIVNLAPADIKKEGPSFDLPIALGILATSGQLHAQNLKDYIIVGELSLHNKIRGVKGILPIALSAKENNKKGIILPKENAKEAAIVEGLNVHPVSSLLEVIHFLEGTKDIQNFSFNIDQFFDIDCQDYLNFSDVKGQLEVKRALEVAVSGAHNILILWTQKYTH